MARATRTSARGQSMHAPKRRAETSLNLTQRRHAVIGSERPAVKADDDRLALDRCQARQG